MIVTCFRSLGGQLRDECPKSYLDTPRWVELQAQGLSDTFQRCEGGEQGGLKSDIEEPDRILTRSSIPSRPLA